MDSLKSLMPNGQTGGGNPASVFFDYLWSNYITNTLFLGMILLILFLVYIARVFVFDNKNIKLNDKSWFYPLIFFLIVALVVWLKGGIEFISFKQYLSDFLTQFAATTLIYFIIGHKAIKALSQYTGGKLNLWEPEPNPPPAP